MKVSLVIMAAGLGSRYGGSKQVDGIGPNGEILMEYSIYDALRAGFNKVVFIIKPEMEQMVRRLCGDALARRTAADNDKFIRPAQRRHIHPKSAPNPHRFLPRCPPAASRRRRSAH